MRKPCLTREDLLHVDGRPWYKEIFHTWVVDPRSLRWRSYLKSQVEALTVSGWHGLLLDTIGDVEDVHVQALSHWLLPATADLTRFIRATAGDRLLIQNSGLFRLLPLTAALLDGICWEGTPVDPEHLDPAVRLAWESLLGAAALHGLTPILLANIAPDKDEERRLDAFAALGRQYGCLTYAAPGDYTSGIRMPDRRIVPGPR